MDIATTIAAATGGVTLVGSAWRGARGLHRFVDAVASNTTAVQQLAHDLRDHTTATTTALTALDQRVTTLESTR
jgi:hypothetical protein